MSKEARKSTHGNRRAARGRSSKRCKKPAAQQRTFPFKRPEGHRAGRPKKPDSGVSHLKRERLAARHPVHVDLRLKAGLPSLRRKHAYRALRRAFRAGCERRGFRLVEYSVQTNHLHLIVEAKDRSALSRGMQGLAIRVARALNKLWHRKGKVFADRYFDRILRTPREVRNALRYVLHNAARHGLTPWPPPDPFSSALWFDGWREPLPEERRLEEEDPPVAPARTWLARVGWRRHGLLSIVDPAV